MKLPRDLSGSELIKLLCKHYGYRRVDQEGSHVLSRRNSHDITASLFQSTRICGSGR
jgi:predicted RNA binding protein YcfA (HicA-like mRNA interferase family)